MSLFQQVKGIEHINRYNSCDRTELCATPLESEKQKNLRSMKKALSYAADLMIIVLPRI